jgi:hypothetical protein
LLRKLPSLPRRPARLGPLAARRSKGTVSLTLVPSRVRNPPRACWEPLRCFLRETLRRGGDSNPRYSCEHNGFRGLPHRSAYYSLVCMNTVLSVKDTRLLVCCPASVGESATEAPPRCQRSYNDHLRGADGEGCAPRVRGHHCCCARFRISWSDARGLASRRSIGKQWRSLHTRRV